MEHKERIFVFGASGHAKVVIDVIEKQNLYQIESLIDDNNALKGKEVLGYKVKGGREVLLSNREFSSISKGIIAVGDNQARMDIGRWLTDKGIQLIKAIHPSAQIARGVSISAGTVIMAHAVINSDCKIGKNVIINTCANVDHDCVIEEGVHIAPGSTLCGNVVVGRGSFIGAGVTVVPNIVIGKNVIVGAGSTVIKNVPDEVKIVGNPAKELK